MRLRWLATDSMKYIRDSMLHTMELSKTFVSQIRKYSYVSDVVVLNLNINNSWGNKTPIIGVNTSHD